MPRPTLTLNRHDLGFASTELHLGRSMADVRAPIGFGRSAAPGKICGPAMISASGDGGIVTIAGTGSGKGVGQVVPTLLSYKGSIIVNDPKGELYAITARRRRELGQEVIRVDPFGDAGTAAINPLALISGRSHSAWDDCLRVSRQMYPGTSTRVDPFWDECARRLVAGTLLFVVTHLPASSRNLDTLRRIWFANEMKLAEILACMSVSPTHGGIIADTVNLFSGAPDRTRNSMLATLRGGLDFLASRRGITGLTGKDMNLGSIIEARPTTIYLTVPPHYLGSHGALLRIWFGTLINTITRRRRRPEIPDLLLVDEAAQLGRHDEILMAASLLRGYGLRTWTFWQSVAQMQSLYGPAWQEIVDNAGAISMFGIGNAASAFTIRAMTGYEGELVGMSPEEQVISMTGKMPVAARRLSYLHDPEYQGLWDANPYHASRARDIAHG